MKYEVIPFGNLLKEPIRNGLTKPKAIRGQGAKMIAMGEIFANSRIDSINMDRVPVTDKELNNCDIEAGDLLFARQSLVLEGAGKCSVITAVDEPTVFESHLIRARIDISKANPYFLYYYFNSHHGKENIKTIVEQVAAAGIRGSDLIKLNVPCPALEEQNHIAEILNRFDEKIELNQKINENLERQAQIFLQRWLLENNGQYTSKPLAEVAEINSDTYSLKESWEYVNYLDTSSITGGTISEIQYICPETEKLPSRARRKVQKGDIVYSTVRPNQRHFGMISSPLPNMLASTGFAVIRSTQPKICNELIYLLITDNNFIEKMQQLAEQSTSTFPSIKSSDLGTCLIPCPTGTNGDELSTQLKTLYSSIAINHQQNEKLAMVRDTLLPKLMSGEIDIANKIIP